jgi:hypothetical protein
MTPQLRKFGCAAVPILAVTLAAFVIHKVFYSKRTLLELHEAGGVTIKVWAEPYRWIDEANILWSVSRDSRTIVKRGWLDAHTNPIWPSCSALRDSDGTVIGIVNDVHPDSIVALYDLKSGFVWNNGFQYLSDRETAEPLASKLQKPGTERPLHLAP